FLTFCYLAAFNCWLLLCPATLSHDWQMGSVPLLTSLADSRNIATCLFFGCCLLLVYRGIADFENPYPRSLTVYFYVTSLPDCSFGKPLLKLTDHLKSTVFASALLPVQQYNARGKEVAI
ncbi:hypothetical protein L9F63_011653, partial [Diploptera punctata]